MLAHSLGARPVIVTDGDSKCVKMTQKNMTENGIPSEDTFVTCLRWGEATSLESFCEALSDWKTPGPSGRKPEATCGGLSVAQGAESTVDVNRGRDVLCSVASSQVREIPSGCKSAEGEIFRRSGEETPFRRTSLTSFDFILAGDVLYKHSLLAPFLKTVDETLAVEGKLLLCHIPRAGVTYVEVEQAIISAGFEFEDLDGGEGCELAAGETITEVGGIELCVDDARRARLYAISRIR